MRGRIGKLVLLLLVVVPVAALYFARHPLREFVRRILPERPFSVVVLDAGHGGKDPGAVVGALKEKDIVLDLANRVHSRLEGSGLRVILTRYEDSYLTLPARADIANRAGRAVLVSLHLNTETTGTAEGVETYYYCQDTGEIARATPLSGQETALAGPTLEPPCRPEQFARAIQSALASTSKSRDRGIKNYPFSILRHARVPAVLIEAGFLSHEDEARLLTSPAYLDILAASIANGIMAYHTLEVARLSHGGIQPTVK